MNVDRLYGLLEARIGFTRQRDVRLERIAADRALEARYTVGTDGSTGIPHPVQQLMARTWPLQGSFKGVWENAVWSYTDAFVADPEQAVSDAWWNSPSHKANLLRPEASTWGLGAYVEPPVAPQRNPRIYCILLLTRDLMTSAIVASGVDFPDGLTAGPLAARLGASIFLTGKSSLPKATRDALISLAPSEILIIGGPGVVDASVEAALSAIAPVRRVAGPNRYETAVAVARA